MLAGTTARDYLMDLKYNTDPSVLDSISLSLAKIKEKGDSGRDSDAERCRYMSAFLDRDNLANFYNAMQTGKFNTGITTDTAGGKIGNKHYLDSLETLEALASIYSKEEFENPFEKINKALSDFTYMFKEPSSKTKKDEKEKMEGRSRMTCSDKDTFGQKKQEPPAAENDPKFSELVKWLDSIKETTETKKKLRQMEKMSDLQRVSATEFIKPKGLFLKKLINKEFWVKGQVKAERFLHVVTDNSGSMTGYRQNRNTAWSALYDMCQKKGIKMEMGFFNTRLWDKIFKIDSKADIEKLYSNNIDGDDNLGRATIEKLNKLNKKSERQYLVMISDGTGSFESKSQSDLAVRLAKEKNVEVKYILFSDQNCMYSTPIEDIFYIYKRKSSEEIEKMC